ncbi:MAG: lipopolysaccharide A protein [Gammaproteobacteria bacterium]|nr:lipopolysaccharide A protein [Gammaproteobacteria bacterium]
MSRLLQSRNNKFAYYLKGHSKRLHPKFLLKLDLDKLQKLIKDFDEFEANRRLNYYYKSSNIFSLNDRFAAEYKMQYWRLSTIQDIGFEHGVYSLDLMEYARFFQQNYKIAYMFGDITAVPAMPSVTKSRPVSNNENSVLMKFDKVRHFYFVNKDIDYQKKYNKLVWRGAVTQPHRVELMEKFFNKSDLIDIGDVNRGVSCHNDKWIKPFMSINNQLQYKFILSVEGGDVATNTKWIMSSNSLCFMTKPKFETWFMEGSLIPNYHYVLIKDDYSNLEEKIDYYIDNTDEAESIIANANNFIDQFKDDKLEDWLQLKVLQRYFKLSNQLK